MRQLMITDRFLPHCGGSRVYYYEICKRLRIPVITGEEKGASEFDDQQDFPIMRHWGIRPHYNGLFKPRNPSLNILINYFPPLFWMIVGTYKIVLKQRPALIHAGGFLFAGGAAFLMQRLFKIPFIVYMHGEEILACKTGRYLKHYLKFILTKADHIIANSEFTRNQLIELGVDYGKITIVMPGVNENYFQPTQTKKIQNHYKLEQKQVILSVGRLTQRKGHIQVIHALPKLIKKIPNLHYVITGVGEERLSLQRFVAEKELSDYVTFTGQLRDHELHALYQLSDLFVLANRKLKTDIEGFGMVFLEAAASGKPVIGGRSGGAVEAIQDGINGYLINPENISEIEKTICELLQNTKLRQEFGNSGRQWASLFAWSKQIKKIASLTHRIVYSIS